MIDIMKKTVDALIKRLEPLTFDAPVEYVYNPLVYAREPYDQYCQHYGQGFKKAIFLGMNPGPWGMVQTGVPFGDVKIVKEWLKIEAKVSLPPNQHPKRPIQGFQCARGEVSGQRLWGWAKDRFGTPKRFFKHFWIANYCPLVFMEDSGRNRTPDKLKKKERGELFEACDEALVKTVQLLRPEFVIGIGNFAYQRALSALSELDITVGRVTHPSPANPRANKGWTAIAEQEMGALGLL